MILFYTLYYEMENWGSLKKKKEKKEKKTEERRYSNKAKVRKSFHQF